MNKWTHVKLSGQCENKISNFESNTQLNRLKYSKPYSMSFTESI